MFSQKRPILTIPAMSYSLIAPVILGFSTFGFSFIYLIWRYELLYTYD